MSRRSTPERLAEARRAGVLNRLTGEGMGDELAEQWVAAWEAQEPRPPAEQDGAYWSAAWDWIAAERSARSRPGH